MRKYVLDFEKPLVEMQTQVDEMRRKLQLNGDSTLKGEISALEKKLEEKQSDIYKGLSRWQRVQVARHPQRPHSIDFIKGMMTDFVELHGDRNFRDDKAVIAGFAKIGNFQTVVIAQEKGRDTDEKIERNFGMMHPEGYRKALRIMNLAEKFNLPIAILIDTPGAYPGIGAEERGQAEAIAYNLLKMSQLKVPVLITIIGEGASGGALGIGIGDRLLMLENAWFSVISPEGCAAILYRDRAEAPKAADSLKVTAEDLMELKIIDKIVPEPPGGAHWNPDQMMSILKNEIISELEQLTKLPIDTLLANRYEKFRKMGEFARG